jgi:tetratricopeptide (TPR) repeat protein
MELQDDYGAAAACRYLGRAHQAQGDLDQALRLYQQGLEKARQFNATESQKNLQGHLLAAIAGIHFEKGQFQDARQKYENALMLYQGTGDQMGVAEMLHQLGKLAFRLKRYNEAEQLYANSLKTIETIQAEQMEAEIYYSQAVLAEKQGFLELAEEKLNYAHERFQSLQASDGLARTEKLLDRIREILGH